MSGNQIGRLYRTPAVRALTGQSRGTVASQQTAVIGHPLAQPETIAYMAEFEVTVTYRVRVTDETEFRSAVKAAATESNRNAAWAVVVDEAGTREVDPTDLPQISLNIESGLALLLGRQPYPNVPGIRFSGMGIDAHQVR